MEFCSIAPYGVERGLTVVLMYRPPIGVMAISGLISPYKNFVIFRKASSGNS
jgi:hypothetical protein